MVYFIIYELNSCPRNFDTDFILDGCLFGCAKLAKNADPDKYLYNGYGIRFDTHGEYSLLDGSIGKSVIILELISGHLCILIIEEDIS